MSSPSDDFLAEYDHWLASAPTAQAIIETVEVSHSTFGTLYLANWHSGVDKQLSDVAGTPTVTFERSQFVLGPPSLEQSTKQQTTLGISAYGGQVYDYFRAMTMVERDEPILIKTRLYLENVDEQLINPAPIWTVHSANVGIDAVSLELRAEPLRIRRVGRFYTATEFPILRLIN